MQLVPLQKSEQSTGMHDSSIIMRDSNIRPSVPQHRLAETVSAVAYRTDESSGILQANSNLLKNNKHAQLADLRPDRSVKKKISRYVKQVKKECSSLEEFFFQALFRELAIRTRSFKLGRSIDTLYKDAGVKGFLSHSFIANLSTDDICMKRTHHHPIRLHFLKKQSELKENTFGNRPARNNQDENRFTPFIGFLTRLKNKPIAITGGSLVGNIFGSCATSVSLNPNFALLLPKTSSIVKYERIIQTLKKARKRKLNSATPDLINQQQNQDQTADIQHQKITKDKAQNLIGTSVENSCVVTSHPQVVNNSEQNKDETSKICASGSMNRLSLEMKNRASQIKFISNAKMNSVCHITDSNLLHENHNHANSTINSNNKVNDVSSGNSTARYLGLDVDQFAYQQVKLENLLQLPYRNVNHNTNYTSNPNSNRSTSSLAPNFKLKSRVLLDKLSQSAMTRLENLTHKIDPSDSLLEGTNEACIIELALLMEETKAIEDNVQSATNGSKIGISSLNNTLNSLIPQRNVSVNHLLSSSDKQDDAYCDNNTPLKDPLLEEAALLDARFDSFGQPIASMNDVRDLKNSFPVLSSDEYLISLMHASNYLPGGFSGRSLNNDPSFKSESYSLAAIPDPRRDSQFAGKNASKLKPKPQRSRLLLSQARLKGFAAVLGRLHPSTICRVVRDISSAHLDLEDSKNIDNDEDLTASCASVAAEGETKDKYSSLDVLAVYDGHDDNKNEDVSLVAHDDNNIEIKPKLNQLSSSERTKRSSSDKIRIQSTVKPNNGFSNLRSQNSIQNVANASCKVGVVEAAPKFCEELPSVSYEAFRSVCYGSKSISCTPRQIPSTIIMPHKQNEPKDEDIENILGDDGGASIEESDNEIDLKVF